jgi:BirA family biotin operon repressor/biotin-[acetyl-CoA-carboxylase] ligase
MGVEFSWPPLQTRIVHLSETGSTNTVAMQIAQEGGPTGAWVVADQQTAGRGRSGRAWVSRPGNLHASLVLRNVVPLEKAAQLALVSGVALHAALSLICAEEPGMRLELKWPNDILLDRRKLGGILVESSISGREQGALAIVGIGLNLAHDPEDPEIAATSLALHGIAVAPLNFLPSLDVTMQEWISKWASGEGFDAVREAWLERSLPLGTGLSVNSGQGIVRGSFSGLAPDGALIITSPSGTEQTVKFGDVALAP